jgi:hypothetical protein
MTDPVSDYLGQYSYDQLCEVEKRIEGIIKRKQSQQLAKQTESCSSPSAKTSSTTNTPKESTFKVPTSPGYNSTEQLAESLGLDISGLLKEAKAWSR